MARQQQASFAKYLRELQEKHFATVKEFARALRVDATHISRAMGDTDRTFDVKGLFRLARVTKENPLKVLRLGGKGEIADIIEEFFVLKSAPDAVRLTPAQNQDKQLRNIVRLYEAVKDADPEACELVLTILTRAEERVATERENAHLREHHGPNGNARPKPR